MPTFSSNRAVWVLGVILALFGVLMGRVVYLQTYGRQQTIRKAERQQYMSEPLAARRGGIFDSTGSMLAGTVEHSAVFVDPKFMLGQFRRQDKTPAQIRAAIKQLAQLVERDPAELESVLDDKSENEFVKIAENVDDKTVERIQKLDLPGVGMSPVPVRFYPMGSLAAHVLGGVGKEGNGLDGLEMRYDKVLAGKDGYERILKDARKRGLSVAEDDYLAPLHGQQLVLELDANIQMIAEQELAATCEKFKAKRGEVVVMDPETGDVLALANYPTFNPQNLQDSLPEVRRNNCLVAPYEAGSTLKPFTAGPAMFWKLTHPTEIFHTGGLHYRTPYGRMITDVHAYQELAMWDVLVKSSNIGMSMLGERMGNANLFKALTGFGFGKPTGIELPGESGGLLNPLKKWNKFSTESVAQGYELMVTPLQLARGMCAYANGGKLVTPRIIKGVLDADGGVVSRALPPERSLSMVMNAETAATMRRILADVPVRGTASSARSDIYNVFGKTGTAHISKNGHYSDTAFNSSFIGGAPYENPRLVIAMVVHEPDRAIAHYGGTVSAPGAVRTLERSLKYLQIPASPQLAQPAPEIAGVLYGFDAKLYTNWPKKPREDQTASARE